MECKITKLIGCYTKSNYDNAIHTHYTGVHFKVDNVDYFFYSYAPEYDHEIALYRGRMKCHVEHLISKLGSGENFIRFTKKPGCLKYVDTSYFLECIKNAFKSEKVRLERLADNAINDFEKWLCMPE